jgi:phage portal protein BeeE
VSLLRQALARRSEPDEARFSTVDDYIAALNEFTYQGLSYTGTQVTQTLTGGQSVERPAPNFAGHASTYGSNAVVFACMAVRQAVFSAVRFSYQYLRNGRGSDLWGDTSLNILDRPWPGGTTQDLLARMIQDVDLAGNSYWVRDGDELARLRPDWVQIVLSPRRLNGGTVGYRRLGYLYYEGGISESADPVPFLADDVAHFVDQIDPLATYRGMSWLTPVAREVQADGLMTRHKRRFFDNGATPNMIIKHPPERTMAQVKEFAAMLDANHQGVDNAYKRLHLGGGADATVVGANMEQIDFRRVQGAGETRIASAANVPSIIVGLSEGMDASTYSNYAQARRRFADGTMHPLWSKVSGTLEVLRPAPAPRFSGGLTSRLFYDARDVPFLREDEKDAAEIQGRRAATIRQLIDAGYTPESVVAAVDADDMRILSHSGLYSVQLQPAGSQLALTGAPDAD